MPSISLVPLDGVSCDMTTLGDNCGEVDGVQVAELQTTLPGLLLPLLLDDDDDDEADDETAAASGSNHASVTPRQPARVRAPSSQFRSELKVVALRAECRSSDWITSSTTSCGRPGGRDPFMLGSDRQSASTQSSVRLLGER